MEDSIKKLTELLINCNVTWNPQAVARELLDAGVTLNPYSKHCYQCQHYLGGGDWNLCCKIKYDLCYRNTNACKDFKEIKTDEQMD